MKVTKGDIILVLDYRNKNAPEREINGKGKQEKVVLDVICHHRLGWDVELEYLCTPKKLEPTVFSMGTEL